MDDFENRRVSELRRDVEVMRQIIQKQKCAKCGDPMSTCKGVIPGTFIACGEGGNYCSVECEHAETFRRLAEYEARERIASLERENAELRAKLDYSNIELEQTDTYWNRTWELQCEAYEASARSVEELYALCNALMSAGLAECERLRHAEEFLSANYVAECESHSRDEANVDKRIAEAVANRERENAELRQDLNDARDQLESYAEASREHVEETDKRIAEAVAAEREACAKMIDGLWEYVSTSASLSTRVEWSGPRLAHAIRNVGAVTTDPRTRAPVCPRCLGYGKRGFGMAGIGPCPACHGTGRVPETVCPRCGGAGRYHCGDRNTGVTYTCDCAEFAKQAGRVPDAKGEELCGDTYASPGRPWSCPLPKGHANVCEKPAEPSAMDRAFGIAPGFPLEVESLERATKAMLDKAGVVDEPAAELVTVRHADGDWEIYLGMVWLDTYGDRDEAHQVAAKIREAISTHTTALVRAAEERAYAKAVARLEEMARQKKDDTIAASYIIAAHEIRTLKESR